MRKLVLFSVLTFLAINSKASIDCYPTNENFDRIQKFAEEANELTANMKETQKVLGITVTKYYTNQGTGKVSVTTDENGNLTSIRADFYMNGAKSTLSKTFDELKNGQRLAYYEGNEENPALVVKKATGATIYAQTGGEFTFSILTKKPGTYQHYTLYLRKKDNEWIVKDKNGNQLESVDLTPNTKDIKNWAGTFSQATFE